MSEKYTKKFWLSFPLWFFKDQRMWEIRDKHKEIGALIVYHFLFLAGECESGGFLIMNERPITVVGFCSSQHFDKDVCQQVFKDMLDVGLAVFENGMWGVSKKIWDELSRYENDREKNRLKTANRRAMMSGGEIISETEIETSTGRTHSPSQPKKSKKKLESKAVSAEAVRLAELLAAQILDYTPDYIHLRNDRRDKTLAKYVKEIDHILSIDKRDPVEVEKIILFATNDRIPRSNSSFCWANIIQSASKLREKYETLRNQAKFNCTSSQLNQSPKQIDSAEVLSIMSSMQC